MLADVMQRLNTAEDKMMPFRLRCLILWKKLDL